MYLIYCVLSPKLIVKLSLLQIYLEIKKPHLACFFITSRSVDFILVYAFEVLEIIMVHFLLLVCL